MAGPSVALTAAS